MKISTKFTDTHAHLNTDTYAEDLPELLKKAEESDVTIFNVGTNLKTSQRAIEIAVESESCRAIVGLHPLEVFAGSLLEEDSNDLGEVFDYDAYKKLAKHKSVIGVGETGLDYFRLPQDESLHAEIKERQEESFKRHIELSIELNLPLMIHCRNAYRETIDILKKYQERGGKVLKVNFHFFAGDEEILKEIMKRDWYVSYTGVITFAKEYEDLIKITPIDRIMSETDCPYVTPEPFRGERNEPDHVKEVVKKMAEIYGKDLDEMCEILKENTERFYTMG